MKNQIILSILLGMLCLVGYAQQGQIKWYEDKDNDGWGTSNYQMASYPSGVYRATKSGDCDDNSFDGNLSNPDMTEVCDGKDNDCDGIIDNVVNATPSKYNLTAGSSQLCSGVTTTITLSGSNSGVSYQLYKNNSISGSSKNGNGSSLVWSGISTGTYKIIATAGASCGTTPSAEMNNQVTIGTNTGTQVYINVPANLDQNNICPSTSVQLSTNANNAVWRLNNQVVANGPIYGFSMGSSNRIISVEGTNDCGVTQSASVTLNASPSLGSVSLSNPISVRCKGSGTNDFNATASNATEYSWDISPLSAGDINQSTGEVTWNSNFADTATISVTVFGSCGQTSSGSFQVTVNDAPNTNYSIAPADSAVCSGNTTNITLSGSQENVTYTLFKNGSQNLGNKNGTGNSLTWTGSQLTNGTYTITASNSCSTVTINDQATVGTTNAANFEIIAGGVTDPNNVCPDRIYLSAGGARDTNPQLSWGGIDSNEDGTPPVYVDITYGESKAITLSGYDECGNYKTVNLTLFASPILETVKINAPIASRCIGNGTTNFDAYAANATSYSWSISPESAGEISNSGTVNWNGSYEGNATISVTGYGSCGQTNSDSTIVEVSKMPSNFTLSPAVTEVCAGSSTTISLSDSQIGVNYKLIKNNTTTIGILPGSGNQLTWSNSQISNGTYKVEATNENGTCGIITTDEITIGTLTGTAVTISTGGTDTDNLCPGQEVTLYTNGENRIWGNGQNSQSITIIMGSSSQTMTLTADNECGAEYNLSIPLNIAPLANNIVISGTQSRCAGSGSDSYIVTGNDAIEFTWSIDPTSAGTISQTGNVVWNASYSGTLDIVVTANNLCGFETEERYPVTISNQIAFYEDKDRDRFYTGDPVLACNNPNATIYVTADLIDGGNDCNDDNADINPNSIWMLDADGDQHSPLGQHVTSCEPPNANYTDYVLKTDAIQLYPLNDCDDSDDTIISYTWYQDADQDDLGDPTVTQESCTMPTVNGPWVLNGNDQCPLITDPTNACIDENPIDDPDTNCWNNGNTTTSVTITGDNYVYSRSYQTERSSPTDFFGVNDEGLIQNITYFDGLGRPIQQIGLEQSPEIDNIKKDIVTQIKYDDFGRMTEDWLPVAMDTEAFGSIKTGVEASILGYYNDPKYENTTNPYSNKKFEESPLNRVKQQAAPGNDWALGAGHEMEFEYQTNADNEVRFFEVTFANDDTEQPQLTENGNYLAGRLYKNVTYDENNDNEANDHSIEEFTDNQGRVILKRTYNAGDPHDTYYVYDDYGNLTFVLPPKMDATSGSLSSLQGLMADLGYQYVYDYRNRLVEKRIPGKGWEYIVYNKLDQPIMTQDANMRVAENPQISSDYWLFTKYDAFGRVAYTGKVTVTNGTSRTSVLSDLENETILWENSSSTFSNGSIDIGYGNDAYPRNNIEVLTVNYYDDYNFQTVNEPTPPVSVFNQTLDNRTKGLATGSKVKVLEDTASPTVGTWITTITRYDNKARPIYIYSENEYLNTVDVVTTDMDFVGRPLKVRSAHTRGATNVVTLDNFTYDHVGRLLTQSQCIGDDTLGDSCDGIDNTPGSEANPIIEDETVTTDRVAANSITIKPTTTIQGTVSLRIDPTVSTGGSGSAASAEELIVSNTYDELGQLVSKNVGGAVTGDGLQTVDYEYNVRGWLEGINDDTPYNNDLTINTDDLWGFRIKYNDIADASKKLYNGNISETLWDSKTDNPGNPPNPQSKKYTYEYDALNRIIGAKDDTGHYNLGTYDTAGVLINPITYDKNGNITRLARQGQLSDSPLSNSFGLMDDLVYAYNSGNRLIAVDDQSANGSTYGFMDRAETGSEYGYDGNGNMVRDDNKGISSIGYNHLNLPTSITINNTDHNGSIAYIYDAVGTKLKKTVGSSVTLYAGNHVYTGGEGSEALQFFNQPEGYVSAENGNYSYVYQYKDHLGNVRLSYTEDPSNPGEPTIIEENNYYPFGLKHKGYNSGGDTALGNDTAQKWSYLGQEKIDDLGLNWLTFRYRNYMPEIGRFFGVDPIAEEYHYITPYQFASNNPVWKVELEGLEGQETSGLDMVRAGFAKIWDAVFGAVKVGQNGITKRSNKERVSQLAQGGNQVFEGAATKEVGHFVLDAAGTADPTPIIDTAHSAWYVAEGEYMNAGLTMAGVFPYFGDSFKALKYTKYSDEIADLVKITGKLDEGKEVISVLNSGTLDDGLKVANDVIGGLGDDAVEHVGKFGNQKGVVTGYKSADGKKGWRVDYDSTKGGHINWWNGKEKGAIILNAGQEQIDQIIKNGVFKQ